MAHSFCFSQKHVLRYITLISQDACSEGVGTNGICACSSVVCGSRKLGCSSPVMHTPTFFRENSLVHWQDNMILTQCARSGTANQNLNIFD